MDRYDEGFQIATLVVIVVAALVFMCYALIFINPQVALNPLKPALPTPTKLVAGLGPLWTPTATSTPIPTSTPTSTPTVTNTPLPTDAPTSTPIRTATATRRPPTRVPAPPVSQYVYGVTNKTCAHSGGTYIEGWVRDRAGNELSGVRVAMGSGPGSGSIYYLTTGSQGRSSGYYVFVINPSGAKPGNYFIWIADGSGKPISDPNAGRVTTNSIRSADDPASCWLAEVDFGRK